MKSVQKNIWLYYTLLFFVSAFVMVFEIIGSKLLAPFVGASVLVWSNIIGVILIALALGYYLGGRYTKPHFFNISLLITSCTFLLLAVTYHPVLIFFDSLGFSHLTLTIIASLFIFFLPSFFLAFVSPYLSEKIIEHSSVIARGIGQSYMIGSLGGIVGTFLTGILLIPLFGVREILFTLGLCIFAFSLIFHRSIYSLVIILIGLGLFFYPLFPQLTHAVFEKETPYGLVRVFDTVRDGETLRELYVDNLIQTQEALETDELASPYAYFYNLAFYYHPKVKKSLMIGGGAYAYPSYFRTYYPDVSLDVVEINPVLTQVAKDFFEFEETENINVFHADGRTFLKESKEQYDVIFMDAFNGFSIPEHLSTQEFASLVYEHLSVDGLIIINTPGSISGNTGKFVRAEILTYQSLFPYVDVFLTHDEQDLVRVQNVMIVARKQNFQKNDNLEFRSLLQKKYNQQIDMRGTKLLTDNYSPVENMNRGLYQYLSYEKP